MASIGFLSQVGMDCLNNSHIYDKSLCDRLLDSGEMAWDGSSNNNNNNNNNNTTNNNHDGDWVLHDVTKNTMASNVSHLLIGDNLTFNSNLSGLISSSSSSSTSPSSSTSSLLSDEARASLIALYTLTTIFAIVGNIIVVIVFAHGRRSKTDIRPFLINLAVADLILAIFCMPFTFTFAMIRNWVFSAPMCPIVLFMQHLSVSASVFTNMAIGIDRFLVVTFPLKARLTTQRAKYTIGIIWLCAMSLSSVQLVVGRVEAFGKFVDCDERWSSTGQRMTFTFSVLFITYIIPLVILSVTYSIVSVIMWRRTAPGNAHEGRDLKQLKAKRKVIKMLVLVVIMFALCWLPIHTFFLVLDFNPQIGQSKNKMLQRQLTIIFYVVHWLAMSNSCANPIIYGFMNNSFRTDFASLCYIVFPFCQCLKKMANRRFSVYVSNNESVFNKRFTTVRQSPNDSLCQQYPCRYGSKVYIELKRDTSRERCIGSMNDFFQEGAEGYGRSNTNSPVTNSRTPCPSAAPRRARRHRSYLKKESTGSSSPLTSSHPGVCDRRSLELGVSKVPKRNPEYSVMSYNSNGMNRVTDDVSNSCSSASDINCNGVVASKSSPDV